MTNKTEMSLSAVLLVELSSMFRSDTHSATFEEFARRLFNNIKKLSSGYSRVDIICDRYFNSSLKHLARTGRGHGSKLSFHHDASLPSNFNDSFLKNNEYKFAYKFQSYQEDALSSFNVTKGQSVFSNSTLDRLVSINTAKEADQKLVRHMIQVVRSRMKQCVVRIVDTDVAISFIACPRLVENFDWVVFACFSSAVSDKFYNINKIAENLGERKCRTLPFSYALTGYDIIFSLFNQDFGIGGQNHRKKRLCQLSSWS